MKDLNRGVRPPVTFFFTNIPYIIIIKTVNIIVFKNLDPIFTLKIKINNIHDQ